METLCCAEIEEVSSQPPMRTDGVSYGLLQLRAEDYSPYLDHCHVGDIKTVGNEEQQILEAPDSFRGSDLGQSPANPGLDGITK